MRSTNLLTLPLALVLALSWRVPFALSQAPGPVSPPANIGQVGNPSGTAGDGGAVESNNLDNTGLLQELPSPSVPNYAGDKSQAAVVSTKGNAIAGVALPKTVEDPESGLAGIMLENKWRTMSTNLLNSPMAIMHMTWQLTEPGVAQGFSNAVAQGGQVLQATYLQKLHESQKDAVMGGVGVQRALERMSCVRSERERATQRGEKDNWYKADAICRGALDITTPSSGAGATGSAPTEADMTGKAATAKDSPALLKYKCDDLDPAELDINSLVRKYIPHDDTLVLNDKKTFDWKPRILFLERFGDVVIGRPKVPAGASGGSKPDPSRNTIAISCLIPPGKNARYQALELEKELWEKFFTLLEARCKASADQQADGAKSYVPFDPAQRNTFWKTNGAMLSGNFDFPGYQFKPATVDIIYGMFIAKELRDVTAEACTARLSPKSPKNNLDFLRNGKTTGSPPEKVRVRQEHIFVFNMLKWITYGQILDRITTWKEWLLNPEKTTINSISAEERDLLLSRVAAAAGLADLNDSLQHQIKANADEFQLFIARVNQLGASMSGQGGSGLVESFAAARDNGSGTIGSGIAGNGN